MLQSDINLAAPPLRVLVADRHEATRRGVRAALERPEFTVVEECGDALTAIAAAVRGRADVCLVDADLPGGAIEAVAAIASLPLAPKVVVVGAAPDEDALLAALRAGASGYLLKDVEPDRLADELRGVAEGSTVLAPALATLLIRGPDARKAVTDREWEAVELLARGLTTNDIAARLRLSEATVRRHLASAVERISKQQHDRRCSQ